MLRWMLLSVCCVALLGQAEPAQDPESQPAESQPTSRPARSRTTLRKPAQVEVLKSLLGQADRPVPVPIRPQSSEKPGQEGQGGQTEGQALLVEGSFLVERPGRLVHEGGRAMFAFQAEGEQAAPRTMQILENQLLETLERESEAGFTEFIISAEVTRYQGSNYLLLRKVLRRTGHGNLSP